MTKKPIYSRIRTAQGAEKSLAQYAELRAAGKLTRAVIIAEHADGKVDVLGQELRLHDIAELLLIAGMAAKNATEMQNKPVLEPHAPAISAEVGSRRKREPEITRDAEGVMVPPAGENIISCGECLHPRFYVLHYNVSEQPSRYACAACGNEIKLIAYPKTPAGHA